MARDHRQTVERGLALKKSGNDLIRVLGGRAIHPVATRVAAMSTPAAPSSRSIGLRWCGSTSVTTLPSSPARAVRPERCR